MSKLIILLVIMVGAYFMLFALAKAAEIGDRLSGICELNSNGECLNQCCNFCNKSCNKKCNANHRNCGGN